MAYNVAMKKKATVDLTYGNVFKTLLIYCLPLFGCAMVQQLYSLVDLVVVGNFTPDGQAALTSLGEANVIINVLLAFGLGCNGGCSVVVARYFGAKDYKAVKETVSTAVFAFSVMCLCVMVAGFATAVPLFHVMSVESKFLPDSLAYLYIYCGSLPFIFAYNIGCAICSALGDSRTPFYFLVLSSLLNVGLDFLFVCVFNLGVKGAAWATLIAQAISAVLTIYVLIKKLKTLSCEQKYKRYNSVICRQLITASIPVILQQSFVSVGNFFIQKRINLIDPNHNATAGFTAAFKLICMANVGVGQMTAGLANFSSQNRAAGKPERIRLGYMAVLTYALTSSCLFGIVFFIFAKPLTMFFISNPDPDAVRSAILFLRIVSCFLPTVCIKIVSDGCVRGCGGNIGFTVSTFLDLGLRVMLVYVLVPVWGFSGVCWAWGIGWALAMFVAIGFMLAIPCMKGHWFPHNLHKSVQNVD